MELYQFQPYVRSVILHIGIGEGWSRMGKQISWDVCPHFKTNFKCSLIQEGNWKEEGSYSNNKWLFKVEMKATNPIPTFGDQRNFFTGLFEVEWKNDNYVFKEGHSRSPQRNKKISMFMELLNKISQRIDIKNMERGMDYYITQSKNEATNNSEL